MSEDSTNYQVVFLINARDILRDADFKNNVISCVLNLLTFYSCKEKAEITEKLQWDFAFFDRSSKCQALSSYRFREWNKSSFENFEQELTKLTSQPDKNKTVNDKQDISGSSSYWEENDGEKSHAEHLKLAFAEVLASFPWDRPLISSPVKRVWSRKVTVKDTVAKGKNKTQTRSDEDDGVHLKTNVLFVLSHCPHSQGDLLDYVELSRMPTVPSLTAHLMPRQILREFSEKKVATFWIDTYCEAHPSDLSGFHLMTDVIAQTGGLITLTAILGRRIHQHASVIQERESCFPVSRVLPDSSVLGYYVDYQCRRYDKQPGHCVALLTPGNKAALPGKLQASLLSKSAEQNETLLEAVVIVGTMPLCQVPLSQIATFPVYALTTLLGESEHGHGWTQLLVQLAARTMVLVVEAYTSISPIPMLGVLQALTAVSGSVTVFKTTGMILMRKRLAFGSANVATSSSKDEQLMDIEKSLSACSDVVSDLISSSKGSPSEVESQPLISDKFDPSLLESWLIPGAIPSSLASSWTNSAPNEEDASMMSRLQMAYMRQKTKRLNNIGSVSSSSAPSYNVLSSPRKNSGRSLASSPRRSPRKHSEPSRRMSQRKAAKRQSFHRTLRTRNSTAPSRVDVIIARSKESRHVPKDEGGKKHGRKSSENPEELAPPKDMQNVPDVQSEEDLEKLVQDVYGAMLEGDQMSRTAVSRILLVVARFIDNHPESCVKELLTKCGWKTAAEISKKYLQGSQDLKMMEYECQISMWIDAVSRSWIKEEEHREQATQQVIMMLRSLSFLRDHGALSLHLAELTQRYIATIPDVLQEVYEELGQPLPLQLQVLFSSKDLDSVLPSHAPNSVVAVHGAEKSLDISLMSDKERAKKKMHRHSSFHAVSKRQIQLNTKKSTKNRTRRSARIASATKTKQSKSQSSEDDTKLVRRNLFTEGGGVKLERRQSVAVMETNKQQHGGSSKAHASHASTSMRPQKGHSRKGSLVAETPAHKQLTSQLLAKQERRRQRSSTVASGVTVVQESPMKGVGMSSENLGPPNVKTCPVPKLYKRTSFYSGESDRVSRNISKYEKLEARIMNKTLLSPCTKANVRGALTSPRRRVHITTLFSKLLDPSPQKAARGCNKSRTPVKGMRLTFDDHTPKKSETATSSAPIANFSSPSKNTRAQMRLFQSPSPTKTAPSPMKRCALTFYDVPCVTTPKKRLSPFEPGPSTDYMSPIRNIRLLTRLLQSPPPTLPEPPRSNLRMTPAKLHAAPPLERFQLVTEVEASSPSKNTIQASRLTQDNPMSPTKTPGSTLHQTPIKRPVMSLDFTSPSSNTRSHSKIFQPPEVELSSSSASYRAPASEPRRLQTTFMSPPRVPGALTPLQNPASILSTPTKTPAKDLPLTAGTPSKNTRLQTRLFQSPSPKTEAIQAAPGAGDQMENSDSTKSNVCLQQPLSTDQSSSPKKPFKADSLNHWPRKKPNVSPVLKTVQSPVIHRRGKAGNQTGACRDSEDLGGPQQENLSTSSWKSPRTPRGKRKLQLSTSPANEGTPTKRYKSSVIYSPTDSNSPSVSSMDYFDSEEVFIESTKETKVHVHPTVELLKQQSTSSSGIPSPIFPGLGSSCLSGEVLDSSAPSSPIFDKVMVESEESPFRSPLKDCKKHNNKNLALNHFSPQLSKFSIVQLVTSPLLDSEQQKKNQRSSSNSTSPEASGTSPRSHPKARKSLIRMPTKQSW